MAFWNDWSVGKLSVSASINKTFLNVITIFYFWPFALMQHDVVHCPLGTWIKFWNSSLHGKHTSRSTISWCSSTCQPSWIVSGELTRWSGGGWIPKMGRNRVTACFLSRHRDNLSKRRIKRIMLFYRDPSRVDIKHFFLFSTMGSGQDVLACPPIPSENDAGWWIWVWC